MFISGTYDTLTDRGLMLHIEGLCSQVALTTQRRFMFISVTYDTLIARGLMLHREGLCS